LPPPGESHVKRDSVSLERAAKAKLREAGLLGLCFGSTRSAPVNIAGITVVALVVPLFVPMNGISADEYWRVVAPVMTLVLGYLFGRGPG
jgi:hypothetical protein